MKRYSRSLSLSVAAIGLALASGCSVAPGASSPPPDLDVNESASQARSTDPLPLLELVSSGGIGRLYTLNENEARTAETVHHMSREPGQVGYMPPQRIAGTTPLYRLKPTASETAGSSPLPTTSETSSLRSSGSMKESSDTSTPNQVPAGRS
jgi:hypothetical protein